MKNNILKAIINREKNISEDEREVLEFNQIITFCFKFLVISLVVTSFIFKPYLADYVNEDAICLYLIGITCVIGSIKLCNKGILILNKNHQILYPAFLFFPFFPLKVIVVIFSFLNIDVPLFYRILLTLVFFIGIIIVINKLYLNGLNNIDHVDD